MSLSPATWEEIGNAQQGSTGWLVRRLHPEARHTVQAARRALDNAIGLLFEIATRSMPVGAALPVCVGFTTTLETIAPGLGGSCRICLVLKDQRYLEIFAALASDVVGRILATDDEPAAVRALLSRLNTWQRFLEKFGLNLLSREEQAGLFAELLVLELEMAPSLGASTAVQSWRGPLGEPHDFRCGPIAVEVKAATSAAPSNFHVSNLLQLEPGSAAHLYLLHVSLGLDEADGLSLPDMVARVRRMLSAADPGAATEFDVSLQEVGYLDIHADAYRDRRFAERARRWFAVIDGFPRLTAVSVPRGVVSARYVVSLADCLPFEVAGQVPRNLLHSRTS